MQRRRPFIRKPLENPPNAIQALRFKEGLSAEALGRELGISGSQLRRVEREDTGLSRKNWQKLAVRFRCETYQLHDPTYPEKN
jgi:ribosome-binding protein aMBF1 (putative translation factor)